MLYECLDRQGLLLLIAVEGVIHLLEGPLCPLVIYWVAGAHLTAPVERETNLVELLTIAVDVIVGSLLRVLTCLYGILLCRQSVGIIAHRIEHVEALQALVASVDITCYVAQGVTDVQSGS